MNQISYYKVSPDFFIKNISNSNIEHSYYNTPAGMLKIFFTSFGVHQVIFIKTEILPVDINFNIKNHKLVLCGTPFQIKVWQAAINIPIGKTVTYQDIAKSIGYPKAYRAVARALAQNKIAYFIPCHRVIRKNSSLSGYAWGIEKKAALLKAERIL